MTFTVFTPTPSQWDAFVRAHPRAHILQMSGWGAHKSTFGWRHALVGIADSAGALAGGGLLLFRPLPLRAGTMAYLAMAPLLREDAPALARAVWDALHDAARAGGAVYMKWEPGIFDSGAPNPTALGFQPTSQTIQPPNTILIDLADDDTMLARMNQGTRRKIRQSLKGEVIYREAKAADLLHFTDLMARTGERNAFGTYPPDYYAGMFARFAPHDAALILAEHQGEALAGVMVFAIGQTAWYLYGGSSDAHRNLMASYGAQWHAIQWARARGCTVYDMWGIPDAPPDQLEAQFESRTDGLWGVYGFKRGWGGAIARTYGAWDYVYQPVIYAAYQIALNRRAGAG